MIHWKKLANVGFLGLLVFVLSTCATTKTPPPKDPENTQQGDPKRKGKAPPEKTSTGADSSTYKTLDISSEVFVTGLIKSGDASFGKALGYVTPHLPPPFRSKFETAVSWEELIAKITGIPALAEVIDRTRPIAFGVSDPQIYAAEPLGPIFAAIPVKDGNRAKSILKKELGKYKTIPGGTLYAGEGFGTLMIRFANGYAWVASHENLFLGTQKILTPVLAKKAHRAFIGRVHVKQIYAKYGAFVDLAVAALDPKNADGKKNSVLGPWVKKLEGLGDSIWRWLSYVQSIDYADISIALGSSDIHIQTRILDGPKGKLPKLTVGPPWGVNFLPDRGAFFYSGYMDLSDAEFQVKTGSKTLSNFLNGQKHAKKIISQYEKHSLAMWKAMTGEVAFGMWVTPDGGISMASLGGLKDKAAYLQAWSGFLSILPDLLTASIGKFVKDKNKNRVSTVMKFVKTKKRKYKKDGAEGELVEVWIKWPRPNKRLAKLFNLSLDEMKELIKTAKKAQDRLVGPKLTVAHLMPEINGKTTAVFFVGKDWEKNLTTIMLRMKNPQETELKKKLAKAVGNKPIGQIFYFPTATVIENIMMVWRVFKPIPSMAGSAIQNVLPGPGIDAPVIFWTHGKKGTIDLNLSISSEILAMITKAGTLALAGFGAAAPPPQPIP